MLSRSSGSSITRRRYGFAVADCAAPRARSALARALRAFVLLSIAYSSKFVTLGAYTAEGELSQSGGERLVDPLDVDELEAAALVLRDLGDVALVSPREDHPLDLRSLGGKHLLLDAADRQHLAGERDLAGHRDIRR